MPRDLATRLIVAADALERQRVTLNETLRHEARAAARDRRPMDPLANDIAAEALARAIDVAADRIAATCAPGPGPAPCRSAPDVSAIADRLRAILEHRWLGRQADADQAVADLTAWLSASAAQAAATQVPA